MSNDKIEELKAIIANESVAPEQRQEAARVLSELESQPENQWERFVANLKADSAAYVKEQNTKFKVCATCFQKADQRSADVRAVWRVQVGGSGRGVNGRQAWQVHCCRNALQHHRASTVCGAHFAGHGVRGTLSENTCAAKCADPQRILGTRRIRLLRSPGGGVKGMPRSWRMLPISS